MVEVSIEHMVMKGSCWDDEQRGAKVDVPSPDSFTEIVTGDNVQRGNFKREYRQSQGRKTPGELAGERKRGFCATTIRRGARRGSSHGERKERKLQKRAGRFEG